ncbi:MAG TPA: PAS domain-containing protein [Mycobacteriales bacterium]|nr:PAS domain-containing protein [Mycobacteriales bacterium]
MEDPAKPVPPPRSGPLEVGGEALFRALVAASPDLTVFVFGSDLRYISAGGSAFERLGWRLTEVVGHRPTDLLDDGSGELLEEQMRAALAGETRVFEHPGIRNGAGFWRSTVSPVRDQDGAVVAGMVVSRDVGPVLAAERGRRESEERFAVALEAAPVTVFAQDRDLRFTWANKTVLNPSVAFILGKTDAEVLPPEAAAASIAAKSEVLETGEPVRVLFEAPTPAGPRWYDMTISPARDEAGAVIGVVGAALEVTELRSSEHQLQVALEAMLDSVTVQKPVLDETGEVVDFRITYATENAVDFAGRGRSELIDRTLRELFPELGDDFIAAYVGVLQTGQGVHFTAFPYPDGEGRELLYDLAVSRVGESLLVTWREVTEREANRVLIARSTAVRSVSEELQRGLLPSAPPDIPGVRFAAVYHPALETAEVGGDWYDVVRHPRDEATAGVVDVIVGDVEGHDGHAAALMARYSTLLRAACGRRESVEAAIDELRTFHDSLDGERLVTISLARIDLDSGQVDVMSAGHPPPILCREDGRVEVVEVAVDPPVGAPGEPGPIARLQLDPGATLVMFSDGLLDPYADPDDAYRHIAGIVRGVDPARPEDMVAALADHAMGHQPSDDVVVVAAHRPI